MHDHRRRNRSVLSIAALGGAPLLALAVAACAPGDALAGKNKGSGKKDNEQTQQLQDSGDKGDKANQAQSQQQFQSQTGDSGKNAGKSDDAQSTTSQFTNNASKLNDQGGGDNGKSSAGKSDGGDGTNSKKGGLSKTANGTDQSTDQKVPSTVAEWLQGIFKAEKSDDKSATVPPVAVAVPGQTIKPASAEKTEAVKPISAKPAPETKPPPSKTLAGHNTPPLPALDRPEMLAVNLSKQTIDKAVALGFRANGTAGVSRLNLGVTRLIAPPGLTAEQAQELLRQSFPDDNFEINKKYRIYRTANGVLPASQSDRIPPALPMPTPCGTDRCFGAAIINWKPQLQGCTNGVKIGVIDTGYDASHPAFQHRSIEPYRSHTSGRPRSPDWHGTGVLALLAGEAKSGTPGLVPNAKFFLADIFFADSDGAPASDTASLIEALDWLDKQHVKIINMSLTGPPDELLKKAVAGLSEKGIIFVAAVGNDGPSAPPSYPSAYKEVIAVTAVDKNMMSYRYATRGKHVDVAAPGVDIWTALPNGQGGYHSGTSFAVPYVTAVLATVYKDLEPKSKAGFLEQANFKDLGEPGRDPIYGKGLLLAPAACGANLLSTITTPEAARIEQTAHKSSNP